jgi:hypothetical protein
MTNINKRDDFSANTKKSLAERSAYLCSNPNCKVLTVSPHSHPQKSLKNGIAAHICAAAPDGPRYDPNQTPEQRKSIENGIWLCHNCSDLVDKDPLKYPVQLLQRWKAEHEIFVSQGGGYPILPRVKFSTIEGLSLPEPNTTITSQDVNCFREHILVIQNFGRREMRQVSVRIQLAEPVFNSRIVKSPVGSAIRCEPERLEFTVQASGGGSVTTTGRGRPRPSRIWLIEAEFLPPLSTIEINLLTTLGDLFQYHPLPPPRLPETRTWYWLIKGSFQADFRGEVIERRFFVPLVFDEEARTFKSDTLTDESEASAFVELHEG